ncbi:methyltransferase OMS1, mitochondrial [Staphylotrichum tortipilum]|uniref:Methyltransferase OMS1, mitochondrial n=1 Tax=Staphylotrichum tortipilum TaxID=2831512 RepID=A0AAN6RSB8_9PEZI|nr:methyltransferase OMS1, mitochondrial [Staphylotrichum longicolle]
MAAPIIRLRIPLRPQLNLCPHITSFSPSIQTWQRSFTLSTRLGATNRFPRRPPPQPPKTQPPPSPSSPGPDTLATLLSSQRKWPFFGAGLAALCLGLYVSLVVTSTLKNDSSSSPNSTPSPTTTPIPTLCSCSHSPLSQPPPTGLPSETSARAFDASLNLPERLSGIASLRAKMAARAHGHVCEVAVGTGRNLRYIPWYDVVELSQPGAFEPEAVAERERERKTRLLGGVMGKFGLGGGEKVREIGPVGSIEGEVLSFTGVDVSGDMVGVARDRVREAVPGLEKVMRRRRAEGMPSLPPGTDAELTVVEACAGRVRLVLADAVHHLPAPPSLVSPPNQPPPPPDNNPKYDTILQTFGLCSVPDPVALLSNMASSLRPDTGRILLLEHGRGFYSWLNARLDRSAPDHFRKYGCWWNRDIEALVREAAAAVPGLEVVKLERPLWFQAGTTLLIELKVASQPQGEGKKKA